MKNQFLASYKYLSHFLPDSDITAKKKFEKPQKMEKPSALADETRKQSIQRCIQSISHACQCRDAHCTPSCHKTKRIIAHTKQCKRKTTGACPICKQLIKLCCHHAKHCQEDNCSVPFCAQMKYKLKGKELMQR